MDRDVSGISVFERRTRGLLQIFRRMAVCLLVMLATRPVIAQVDSLVDLLPLEEGNRWTYRWSHDSWTAGSGHDDRLNGTVDYVVVDEQVMTDSIRWVIFARRNLARMRPGPSWVPMADSLTFGLVEQLDGGGHHLYYENAYPRIPLGAPLVFDFHRSYPLYTYNAPPDTFRLYRFGYIDSTRTSVRDYLEGLEGQYHFRFRANAGVDSVVVIGMLYVRHYTERGSLLEAHFPATRVPACIPSRNYLFVKAVQGLAFDSVIVLANPGTATLRIGEVHVTNNRFTAYVEDTLVASTSAGRLHVRFEPWEFRRDTALIIITSNAPSSPDTVEAIVDTREPTLVSFNTQFVDTLQETLRGAVTTAPLLITNAGERPLVFDAITSDNPMFSLVHTAGELGVGSSIVDSVKFRPVTVGWQRARIIFYTNAVSSPDTVIAKGFGRGALAGFNRRILEFGLVPVGASKESSFTVTNYGTSPLVEGRFRTSNPAFVVVDSLVDSLQRGSSTRVRVRYDATGSQPQTGMLLFTYQENLMPPDTLRLTGSIVAGVAEQEPGRPLAFRLEQNYPNPFNSETVIHFALAAPCRASLKVFNLLGQEISTLAEEDLAQGAYKRTFDGSRLPSGVYIYRLTAGSFVQSRTMLLCK